MPSTVLLEKSLKTKIYPCEGTYIYIDVPSEEAVRPTCLRYAQESLTEAPLYCNTKKYISFISFQIIQAGLIMQAGFLKIDVMMLILAFMSKNFDRLSALFKLQLENTTQTFSSNKSCKFSLSIKEMHFPSTITCKTLLIPFHFITFQT